MRSFAKPLKTIAKAEAGATNVRISHGGKHPRLECYIKGRRIVYSFPSTASDRRALANAESQLRNLLGISKPCRRKASKRNSRRRKKSQASRARGSGLRNLTAVTSDTSTAVKQDYKAVLAEIREAMTTGFPGGEPATPNSFKPVHRLKLRTPWLGKHQRFTTSHAVTQTTPCPEESK
jgi:hypothetical protein